MVEPFDGLVISYDYLWAREYDRREGSGRKARPACVQIILSRDEGEILVALFPITSQSPRADQTALEVPQTEARRAGLATRSWIVIDEWNLDDLAKSPHIADPRPLGRFSEAFMRRIRSEVAARLRARRHRSIPRR